MVAPPGRTIFPDGSDIAETGRMGPALSEMRIEDLAQQFGHAATFALSARLEGLVLPIVEEDLSALHVLHHTQ